MKRFRPWLIGICLALDLVCSLALPLAPAGMVNWVFGVAVVSMATAFGLVWWVVRDHWRA